jgi:hypothetical protein
MFHALTPALRAAATAKLAAALVRTPLFGFEPWFRRSIYPAVLLIAAKMFEWGTKIKTFLISVWGSS